MTKRANLIVLVAAIAIAILGCASFSSDVSNDDVLWGGYDRRKDYKLLRDVFLIRVNAGLLSTDKLVLVPERSMRRTLGRHHLAPNSIREYQEDPKKASTIKLSNSDYVVDVVGILPAGTRLRCSELHLRTGWSFMVGSFKDLTPLAKVIEGSFAGTLVDITDVSVFYREDKDSVFKYRPEEGVVGLASP